MLKNFKISQLQKFHYESRSLGYGVNSFNLINKNYFQHQQNKRSNEFYSKAYDCKNKFNFSNGKIVNVAESIENTIGKYQYYIISVFALGSIFLFYQCYDIQKVIADKKSGIISQNMERINITPRKDWQKKVVEDGLTFYNMQGIRWGSFLVDDYWNEQGAIKITQSSEQEIIQATFDLHNMCLELVECVIKDDNLLKLFEIPDDLIPAVKKSWNDKRTDLMGRFDLAWDGNFPPKLLEYNADTPSVLVESAAPQMNWCMEYRQLQKEVPSNAFQCNYVESALKEGFKLYKQQWDKFNQQNTLGIVMVEDDAESIATANYLKKIAESVGCKTLIADVKDFSFDYDYDCSKVISFIKSETIDHLLKLYPYEWLVQEINRDDTLAHDLCEIQTVEPAWKLILGNKAILPLLWAMFPGHKNLLPAYFDDPHKEQAIKQSVEDWVSKPKFGREGEGVLFSHDFESHQDFIDRTNEQPKRLQTIEGIFIGKSVYQQFNKLPIAQDRTILLSSWVINGMPAGICFREDTNVVTNNNSCFIPHFVVPDVKKQRNYQFSLSKNQIKIREQLYEEKINERIYKNVQIGSDPLLELNQSESNNNNYYYFNRLLNRYSGQQNYQQPNAGSASMNTNTGTSSNKNTNSNQNVSNVSEDLKTKRKINSQEKKVGGRVFKQNIQRSQNFGRIARASGVSHG